jgi:hypothetical protein
MESLASARHGIVVPDPANDPFGLPAHFHDEPTVWDVIAQSMHDRQGDLGGALVDFAIDRALDPIDRPTLEWEIKASSLPRRLMIDHPVEPTGATFVRIDVDAAPKSDSIEIDLKWELGSTFRWAIVKLDAQGKIAGTIPVAALERLREITVAARDLAGVSSLLVVGVNAGDPDRPWAPDQPITLPHAYEIGVFEGA